MGYHWIVTKNMRVVVVITGCIAAPCFGGQDAFAPGLVLAFGQTGVIDRRLTAE